MIPIGIEYIRSFIAANHDVVDSIGGIYARSS
jgi:hypothetical protein